MDISLCTLSVVIEELLGLEAARLMRGQSSVQGAAALEQMWDGANPAGQKPDPEEMENQLGILVKAWEWFPFFLLIKQLMRLHFRLQELSLWPL